MDVHGPEWPARGEGLSGGSWGGQVFPRAPGFLVYIVVPVQPAARVCGLVNKTFRVLRKSLERAELARSSITLLFKRFVCSSLLAVLGLGCSAQRPWWCRFLQIMGCCSRTLAGPTFGGRALAACTALGW